MNISEDLQRYLVEIHLARYGAGQLHVVGPTNNAWSSDVVSSIAPLIGYGTIGVGAGAATAGRGDTILMLPGTYALTAALALSKSHVRITGLPGRERETIITGAVSAGVDVLTISGASVEIAHLTLRSGSSSSFCASVSGAKCRFDTVYIDIVADTAHGIELLAAADDCTMENCDFFAVNRAVNLVAAGGAAPDRLKLIGASFRGCVIGLTDAGSAGATHFADLLVKGCDFGPPVAAGFIKLDTIAGGTGVIAGCTFGYATNASSRFILPAGVAWANNATEAGLSAARPS